MAQAVHPHQQKKDLELVFSLQSHYKHFFKNYGDIVGVYDIPSITMQWESFKSYLLKNSGLLFDNSPTVQSTHSSSSSASLQLLTNDVQIRYVNTSGAELPINTQDDFQYALYTFRERARAGEINHLKLIRLKGGGGSASTTSVPVKMPAIECDDIFELDADERGANGYGLRRCIDLSCGSGGDGLLMADGDERTTPEWFAVYMKKFKQEIIQEITKVNTTQMSSNMKKMQSANHVVCPKRRQNKSEHYKRRPKMTYANNIVAMENTSCDNTDINTIATTPIIANPQKHSPPSSKLNNVAVQPTKSDIIKKQIQLKAKRLVAARNSTMRGSSDSDTVVKSAHIKNVGGTCARRNEQQAFNFEKFVVQQMDQGDNKLIEQEELQNRPSRLEVCIQYPNSSEQRQFSNLDDTYNKNPLKVEQTATKSTEVSETQSWVYANHKMDNIVDVKGVLAARVLGEERTVCMERGTGETGEVYMQTWKLENSGTKTWDNNTALQFGWGSIVPYDATVPCPTLKPGEMGHVSLFYKIPGDVGTYECYCHLVHHGCRFGPFLGFKASVTAAGHGHQRPRTVITSIRPPQLPSNMTMSAALASHCNQPKAAGDDEQRASLGCATEQRSSRRTKDEEVMVDGDVVAVIQGVVVREGDVVTGRSVGCGEAELSGAGGGIALPCSSFKRFKGNEKLVAEQQKGGCADDMQKYIRIENKNIQKAVDFIHVGQNNPYFDPYYESDSDYDIDDYCIHDKIADCYVDCFRNDKNNVKDTVTAHKNQLQDNSDSDNASIVSIAESQPVESVNISATATIAGSCTSGTGSASDEFVVIPMPQRPSSVTLSDCEVENDSCPELELEPECASIRSKERVPERDVQNNTRDGKGAKIVKIPGETNVHHTDGLPPDSMTTALAIALKRLQDRKQPEQAQSDDTQQLDNTTIQPTQNQNKLSADVNIPAVFTAEKPAVNKAANGRKSSESGFDRWLSEQQTCPVDLSTNSSKTASVTEIGSQKCGEMSTGNKTHCAATLCDLCTNIIIKNKIDKTKNRLFVFPEDSPGFEVFSSVAKTTNPNEDSQTTQNISATSETRETLYEKMRAEDVGISLFNQVIPPMKLTIVKKEDTTYVAQQNNFPQNTFSGCLPNTSTTFDFSTAQTSTPKQPQTQPINPCTFKSSLNLKKRGKDTYYDSCSSSNGGSSFICPSCQCDGLCWRYQGKTESDYRHYVDTAEAAAAAPPPPMNADEIRAQMRNLFVQLAELEPMKDPYLAKVVDDDKKIETVVEEQRVKIQRGQECSERAKVPLFMQRQVKDRKRLKIVKTFPADGGIVAGGSGCRLVANSGPAAYVETLAEQFQTNLRLTDFDEPMPDVATDVASVAVPDEEQQQQLPLPDVATANGSSHPGCPFKTHLFHEHEDANIKSEDPNHTEVVKLIDVPTPEGSFIEGATAPIENDIIDEEFAVFSEATERQQLLQLHCSEDNALGDNMRVLFEMGFPNFFVNLNLLQSNDNNIVLVLEKLLNCNL